MKLLICIKYLHKESIVINMKLYARNSIVNTVEMGQNGTKIPGFDGSFSMREGARTGLLIRHALTCVQKFKSSTLRIATFSNEKSVTTSNKKPGGFVHLAFFVLVENHSANFWTFVPNWDKMGQNHRICFN